MGHPHQQEQPNVYGRYETLFRIAAGGMAEVYAARVRGEAGFEKLVALKRMLPHLTDDDRFVTMFMDEGKLAANISSPNVVSTMDLGRADDGSLYLVMELVVGTTLSGLLRNVAKDGVSLPIDVAVEMLAQAAQGLHDAHEAKTPFGAPLHIVHRDVSPQNILVGVDGRVRITDFGVARAILRRTKTSTGEFKGKLSYFSPEQCADKNLDRRSDVFSLGVVAWETLTTRRLFHAENPLAVLERVTRMPIPSAHDVCPQVPPEVAAVVASALERDRDARVPSAAEFARALRDAARQTVGSADRHRVAELVQGFGGDSLARVQRQLKQSLSTPSALLPSSPTDQDKTEISSGIVFRNEDGEPTPATPRPPAAASHASGSQALLGAPTAFTTEEIASQPTGSGIAGPGAFLEDPRSSAAPASPTPSRLPLIIATLVAVLGLGAGAAIGVIAATGGSDEAEVTTLPSTAAPDPVGDSPQGAAPDEAADDSAEGERAARAGGDGSEGDGSEGDGAESDRSEGDGRQEATRAAPGSSPSERSRAARRSPRRSASRRDRPQAGSAAARAEDDQAVAAERADPSTARPAGGAEATVAEPREERARTAPRRARPRPRTRPQRTAPPSEPEPQPSGRRRGGLVGVDGFDQALGN